MICVHAKDGIKGHDCIVLHVDGGCQPKNPGGVATAGWAIFDAKNSLLVEEGRVVQDGGEYATNNAAEYCALGFAITYLVQQRWRGELTIKSDSRLLVEQILGRWKCKAKHLERIRNRVWHLMNVLGLHRISEDDPLPPEGKKPCSVVWVPREQNEHADRLSREAYERYVETHKGTQSGGPLDVKANLGSLVD